MTITDDGLLTRLRHAHNLENLAAAARIESEFDASIIKLWARGFNTVDIARYAKVGESKVANRLAALRDGGAL